MDNNRLLALLTKYQDKCCTEEELQELEQWYDSIRTGNKPVEVNEDFANQMLAQFRSSLEIQTPIIPIQRRKIFRIAIAASVIVVAGLAVYFMGVNKIEKNIETAKVPTLNNDVIAPGLNKAMITLADGSTVSLDKVSSGQLAQQGNVKLVKMADGQIVYQTSSGEVIKELQYNTLTNPRGSKVIDLGLADGSHVWLNAGSSITFPVAFASNERKVSINGEAYFEIAHHAEAPFIVKKGAAEVRVLGTHFNINAYDDETVIKVTLLQGLVKVSNGNSSALITPGQQAQIKDAINIIKNIEVDEVMAWKNGKFQFDESANINSIMSQISRWYDIEVEYEGVIEGHIGGTISRDVNVSKVLEMLEMTGVVKFKTNGKKVSVIPVKK